MSRPTAADLEIARHRVDLDIFNRAGDVVESHRMQSWDVSRAGGELLGAFRAAHGYEPTFRIRFMDNRDGYYLAPPTWAPNCHRARLGHW